MTRSGKNPARRPATKLPHLQKKLRKAAGDKAQFRLHAPKKK